MFSISLHLYSLSLGRILWFESIYTLVSLKNAHSQYTWIQFATARCRQNLINAMNIFLNFVMYNKYIFIRVWNMQEQRYRFVFTFHSLRFALSRAHTRTYTHLTHHCGNMLKPKTLKTVYYTLKHKRYADRNMMKMM